VTRAAGTLLIVLPIGLLLGRADAVAALKAAAERAEEQSGDEKG
jgi:hypothetical protein